MKNLYIILVLAIFFSCNSTPINETNEEGLAGDVLTIFFNQGKVNVLRLLTNHFEEELCSTAEDTNRTACYIEHSNRLKKALTDDNMIERKVFPYNSNIGLNSYPNKLHLDFIWKSDCVNKAGKKHYCLKREGNYMKFLKEIGRYNPTILKYYNEYSKNGKVSKETLAEVNQNASEVLDFNQFNHRLFYLVHHLTNDAAY